MTNFEFIQLIDVKQLARFLVDKVILPSSDGIGISDVRDDVAQKEIEDSYNWLQQPVELENTSPIIQKLNWLRSNTNDTDVKKTATDAMRIIESQEYIINRVRSRKQGKFE